MWPAATAFRKNRKSAPGIALALFALAFTLSTFVIGPAIRGDDAPAKLEEPQADPHGH